MEILIQVFLIIIIIYLIALFIYLAIRYYKILTYLNSRQQLPSKLPEREPEKQKNCDQDCEEYASVIAFEESKEDDDSLDINKKFQTNYVTIPLQNQDYQKMIISNQMIKYEVLNAKGMKTKATAYEFQNDQNFNQKYCHYEYTKNEIIIYNGKEEKYEYKGKNDHKQLTYFLGYDEPPSQEKCFYNNLITKQYLEEGHINVLNAFVEYINTQERKCYLTKNENHLQTKKMRLFIPISVMNETNSQLYFKNYLFQYKPIQYQLELFCEKVFFVSSRYDNPSHPILFEINFTFKAMCIVHDLKQTLKEEKIKNQYLKSIKKIYSNVSQVSFCIDCNFGNQQKVGVYDVCQQLLNYSSDGQNQIYKNIDISEYIQKELFKL